jgi:glycerol-3-phosphate O-acyltransferase
LIGKLTASRQEVADRLCDRIVSQNSPEQLHSLLCELGESQPNLATGTRTNREDLRRVADHYLRRMSIEFSAPLHRFASVAMPMSLGLAFGGMFENQVRLLGSVDEIEVLSRRGTVVLACTHSSNLDALVLGAALARRRLPPFAYPAGKHLYRNRWSARMVTGLGGYQLDRSISATLYKKLVVEYSALLLEEGCHSVVFASGTRSRSNEVETRIKLGLLGSVLRAHRYGLAGGGRPIFVVPVTINHLVVPEARVLIQYALEGRQHERVVGDEVGKQGSPWSIARRVAGFQQHVSLCFGEPMTPFGTALETPMKLGAEHVERDAEHTRRLGEAVAAAFKRGTRFQSTHVVARALFDVLAEDTGSSADRATVLKRIESTRRLIMGQRSGGSLMDTTATATADSLLAEATRAWERCHQGGVIRCNNSQVTAVDLPLLLYYRNRSVHIHN